MSVNAQVKGKEVELVVSATVWICDNCGGYYASHNAGDLREKWNTDNKGQRTFTRSRCPTKQCADRNIHRRPVTANIKLEQVKEGT